MIGGLAGMLMQSPDFNANRAHGMKVILATERFKVPHGVSIMGALLQAGGGGGAGGGASCAGAGGAGGQKVFKTMRVTSGQVLDCTVGGGGGGGPANVAGATGGNTTIVGSKEGTITAFGGYGGPTPSVAPGNATGINGGGDAGGQGGASNASGVAAYTNSGGGGGGGGLDSGSLPSGGAGGSGYIVLWW